MVFFWIEGEEVKEQQEFEEHELDALIIKWAEQFDVQPNKYADFENSLRHLRCYVDSDITLLIVDPTIKSSAPVYGGANDATVSLGADGNFEMHGSPGPGVQIIEGDGINDLVDMIEGMNTANEGNKEDE